MRRRRYLIGLLCVVLGLLCTSTAQRRINDVRAEAVGEELLYLPNEKLLVHFTGGMDSIIADLLWIRCIQYTAEHFKGDGEYLWLYHMCSVITRLDPYFMPVYRYGGIFLSSLKADDDASLKLLRRGMEHCPHDWELPYEAAMIYLLGRRDHPGSHEYAAHYLAMAVETGSAPPFVVEVASSLQSQYDLTEIERRMWEATLQTGDELLRDLAERKLQELVIGETCGKLDEAVAEYRKRLGRSPNSLQDLVRDRVVVELPKDPLGGNYFLDANGAVQNTTLLDARVERSLKNLRRALDMFRKKTDNWPSTLEDLIGEGVMGEIPSHPYAGRTWRYDPGNGDIR
ncbi:MAG: hypothetical protein GWP08_08565 [Nitrospiraceae bacterium]|nr:hypothetical protein [Nitrospiraceae bacterium]